MRISEDQSIDERFETNYGYFIHCPMKSTLFVDRDFLEEMGMYETIEHAFEVAGWKSFMTLACETNMQDVCEFLASLEEGPNASFRYRHRGTYYVADGRDLKEAFGWDSVRRNEPDTHSNREAWSVLSGGLRYASGRSTATEIVEPKFFYLQKLLAHSITGRKAGSQKPSLADMEILRGFLYERKVPFGTIMWIHWDNLEPTGIIFVGGLITHFLKTIHGTQPLPNHEILEPEFLDREKMRTMKTIKISTNNIAHWSYNRALENAGNQEGQAIEEVPEGSNRRRGRTHTRAQSRAQTQAQSQAQSEEQTSVYLRAHTGTHADSGGLSPRSQRYWMFNTSRVMDYLAPASANLHMEPPPDWNPRTAIPPEYRIHDGSEDDE